MPCGKCAFALYQVMVEVFTLNMSNSNISIKQKSKINKIKNVKKGKGKRFVSLSKAPSSYGYSVRNPSSLSFMAAPYHQTVGNGLRLEFRHQVATIKRGYSASDYSALSWPFSTTSSFAEQVVGSISSTFQVAKYANANGIGSIWSAGYGSASPARALVGLFSRYCIRKLKLEYVPTCSTNTSVQVEFAATFDVDDYTSPTSSQFNYLSKYASTPAWKACDVTIIADRDMKKPSVDLWDNSSFNGYTVSGTKIRGDQAQVHLHSQISTPTTTPEVFGNLYVSGVVDLYTYLPVPVTYTLVTPSANLNSDLREWVVSEEKEEKKVSKQEMKMDTKERLFKSTISKN